MCWACYTSLTGGAVVAGGAMSGGGLKPGAMTDSGDKKKFDPKFAVIGVGLLVIVGFGISKVMGGSEEDEPLDLGKAKKKTVKNEESAPAPVVQASTASFGAPAEVPKGQSVPIGVFPYNMVAPPNPKAQWAVVGIVATTNELNDGQARGLAAFAHRQLDKVKKFPTTEIYVFNDVQAAQAFATYQNLRRGAQLTPKDYQSPSLTPVWNKALVRYLSFNNRVFYSSPARNPAGFWAPVS